MLIHMLLLHKTSASERLARARRGASKLRHLGRPYSLRAVERVLLKTGWVAVDRDGPP